MVIILQVNEIIIDHLHIRIAVLFRINPKGSCGPMDKAPVYGTGDSGFEPRQELPPILVSLTALFFALHIGIIIYMM